MFIKCLQIIANYLIVYNLSDNRCISKVTSAEGCGFNYIIPIEATLISQESLQLYAMLGSMSFGIAKQFSTIFNQLPEML